MKTNIFLLIIIVAFNAIAQDDEYYFPPLEFKDKAYSPKIKSVHLSQKDWQMAPAMIELGSDDQLRLSFDLIGDEVMDYTYTLIHCTPDWQESDIMSHEYIDGFTEDNILNYDFSFNTITKYIHYDHVFPTENMKITKSGNYLIKVFQNGDYEDLVLTRRFMVVLPLVEIIPNVHQATLIEDRYYKHEIDFNLEYNQLQVSDPFNEFQVVLMQNERWDNVLTGLKPVFIRDNSLIYDYDRENVFNAGNEYRHFNIQNLNYFSDRIDSIYHENDTNKVILFSDSKRSFKKYTYWKDINGKRMLGLENNQAFNTDADYAEVHFNLPFDNMLDKGSIYVFGQLTDWNYLPEARMVYNYKKRRFETSMFLKQGYYNYEYIYVEGDDQVGDNTFIEGSHYQTDNSYRVLVYFKSQLDQYYKLVGTKTISSL